MISKSLSVREEIGQLMGLQRICKEFSLLKNLFSNPLCSKSTMFYNIENSYSWLKNKYIWINNWINILPISKLQSAMDTAFS